VVAGLAGFRGGERAFRAWLFTIARHRAADWARAQARHRTVPLSSISVPAQPTSPDAADVVLERMSTQAALELVSTLPRDQAEIIILRVLAGLQADEVARIVGKSPGAVRVAAHRALRRLAALADRAGLTALACGRIGRSSVSPVIGPGHGRLGACPAIPYRAARPAVGRRRRRSCPSGIRSCGA
jgi:RNA polymerase sigma-70 factor, ECF subfamily